MKPKTLNEVFKTKTLHKLAGFELQTVSNGKTETYRIVDPPDKRGRRCTHRYYDPEEAKRDFHIVANGGRIGEWL